MISHRHRLWALGLASLASMLGIVGLTIAELTSSQAFALLVGVFTVAIAGFWDALRVESRRKDPRVPAIKDDVISEEAVNAESPLPTSCFCKGCTSCKLSLNSDFEDGCRRTAVVPNGVCVECARTKR